MCIYITHPRYNYYEGVLWPAKQTQYSLSCDGRVVLALVLEIDVERALFRRLDDGSRIVLRSMDVDKSFGTGRSPFESTY